MTGLSIKTLLKALRRAELYRGYSGDEKLYKKWEKYERQANLFERKIIEKYENAYAKGRAWRMLSE